MAHTHGGTAVHDVPRPVRRVLAAAVATCAVVVIVGMALLWPRHVSAHLNASLTSSQTGGATATARIDSVAAASCRGVSGSTQATANSRDCGQLGVTVLDGASRGATGTVVVAKTVMDAGPRAGQRVVVGIVAAPGQPLRFQFVDYERTWALVILAVVFVAVLAAVARWRGLLAVVGLAIAACVLGGFVFPALVSGTNPVAVGLLGSIAIMLVVIYTAHGVSARSTTALLGTIAGIVACAGLSVLFTRATHLTGVVQEDDTLLAATAPALNLQAALMCAILIAGLGVLNDVTITQASAVWELADAGYAPRTLFRKAMRIGRDHIASTVYTIAFATAGASLTTFLLITAYRRPLGLLVQTELFAEEIVRTLVGAIGLVLAVPLTTLLAVAVVGAGASEASAGVPAGAGPRS